MSANTGTATLRVSPAEAARHGLTLAGRGVTKFLKSPEDLVNVILTPIVFLLMFVYLFGGAIAGGHLHDYLRTITPGIMVMTVFQASIGIGVALNADASTGVFDRFRSMPIARSAPLVGAVIADAVRYAVCLATLLALASVMGYRTHTNPAAVLAGIAFLMVFGLSFCWVSVYIGILAKSPRRGDRSDSDADPAAHLRQQRVRPGRHDAGLAARLVRRQPDKPDGQHAGRRT